MNRCSLCDKTSETSSIELKLIPLSNLKEYQCDECSDAISENLQDISPEDEIEFLIEDEPLEEGNKAIE